MKTCYIILLLFFIISIPAYSAEKMRIAIIDFQAKDISKSDAIKVSELIRNEMINVGEFIVIERTQMKEILKEQGLQQSGCTDISCAVEIGKVLSARKILVGTIMKLGRNIIITGRIVDVEKGIAEFSEKEIARSKDVLPVAVASFTKKLSYRIKGIKTAERRRTRRITTPAKKYQKKAKPKPAAGKSKTDAAFITYAGYGFGSVFAGDGDGSSIDSDKKDEYIDKGKSLFAGGMFIFDIFALDINYAWNTANKIELDDGTIFTNNSLNILHICGGFAFARKPGDMGYTMLYGGYRMWIYKYEYQYLGIDYKIKREGSGWITGIRDVSTISYGSWSLLVYLGFFIDGAPQKKSEVKYNDITEKNNFDNTSGISMGWEAGAGIAFESIGLSILFCYREDNINSVYDYDSGDTWVTFGIRQFIFTATYQLDF